MPHVKTAASREQLTMCRDGTVYGCGSTEQGQLPYLRFSQDGSADSLEEASMSAAELENIPARNEITIPTQLRLPVRQACTILTQNTGPYLMAWPFFTLCRAVPPGASW